MKAFAIVTMCGLLPSLALGAEGTAREHPYMYFSAAEWSEMRARLDSPLGNRVMELADAVVGLEIPAQYVAGPSSEVASGSDWLSAAGGVSWIVAAQRLTHQAETLAFAYRLTGEKRYAEAAKRLGLTLMRWETWAYSPVVKTMLDRAIAAGTVNRDDVFPPDYDRWHSDLVTAYLNRCGGVVYDWLYDTLSQEEQEEIRVALWRKGITPTVNDARDGVWWSRILNSNYSLTLASGAGQAAIAIAPEHPQAEPVIREMKDNVTKFMNSMGHEGGWQEGFSYWSAIHDAICFDIAYASYSQELLILHPFYKLTARFPFYFTNPHMRGPKVQAEFCDTIGGGGQAAELYWLASHTRDAYVQWLADELCARALEAPYRLPKRMGDPTVPVWRTFAFYDTTLEGKRPRAWLDLPPSKLFGDIQWAVLRDSWEDGAVCMPFKSGKLGYFHRQLDINSFELWANREKVIVELGRGPYGTFYFSRLGPEKVPYVSTAAHNTLMVNGQGQQTSSEYLSFDNVSATYFGTIPYFYTTQEYDYLIGDGSKAYDPPVERFARHVIFLRPDTFVLIDDVVFTEDALPELRFHAAKAIDVTEEGFVARASDAAVAARLLAPDGARLEVRTTEGVPARKAYPYVTVVPPGPCTSCTFVTLMRAGPANVATPSCRKINGGKELRLNIEAGGKAWTIVFSPSSELIPAEVRWR